MRGLAIALFATSLFAAGLAGTYKGSWSGGAANGDITIALAQNGADWKSDVTFTINGEAVKTKVTSVKVNGPKVRIVYQFDLQGTVLESTATGELKGSVLEGQYQTKSVADGSGVDEGTWKTTAQ